MSIFSRFTRLKSRQITVFDGQDYRKAMLAASAWLEQHRETINKLNVFPVPDGDTGTNMAATMRAATKEIADTTDTNVSVVAHKLSEGAIRGARGNSGVILSQILRGIAQSLDKKATFTAHDFSNALQHATHTAYRAVIKPVEGTILTVIRESAEAAQQASERGLDITTMMQEIVTRARQTVARTPELLPTLKQAGVVDAGGQGLTTIFEGFLRYTRGETIQPTINPTLDLNFEEVHRGAVSIDEEYGYEVVFLLHGTNLNMEEIRDTIVTMGGESTVVAGDETIIKVHTHTLTPGKILDYGVSLGSLDDINIENLQAQSLRYAAASAAERGVRDTSTAVAGAIPQSSITRAASRKITHASMPIGEVATVAVVSGSGFEEVFASFNVNAIVQGGQTMNPSTQELLDAVNSISTSKVIILPNNGNIIMSARQVNELTNKDVRVVPTKSMPQGMAALMAFNYEHDFDMNVKAMEAALHQVSTGEICYAIRDAQLDGITVHNGDIIGMVDDVMVSAGTEEIAVLRETLEKMCAAEREVITLYYGADITHDAAQFVAQRVGEWYPDVEIEVVEGGQPHYTYIISAE
jgi:uncharacterized protein